MPFHATPTAQGMNSDYRRLQQRCKAAGLSAKGSTAALQERLGSLDPDEAPAKDASSVSEHLSKPKAVLAPVITETVYDNALHQVELLFKPGATTKYDRSGERTPAVRLAVGMSSLWYLLTGL